MLSPLVELAAGFVNGVGITKLRMPHPFIMTLGMLFMARGLANLISGGVPYSGLPDPVRFLGSARILLGEIDGTRFNLPVVFLFTVAVYLIFWGPAGAYGVRSARLCNRRQSASGQSQRKSTSTAC